MRLAFALSMLGSLLSGVACSDGAPNASPSNSLLDAAVSHAPASGGRGGGSGTGGTGATGGASAATGMRDASVRDASTATGGAPAQAMDAGSDAMVPCATTTCGDGSCVEQHVAFDACGCAQKSCTAGFCVRGTCAGGLVMDLPEVGPPLAIDGASAYGLNIVNDKRVELYRIDDGATASVKVSGLDVDFVELSRPAIDATYLYFVVDTYTGRKVYRTPKAGGAYEMIAQEGTNYTNAIDIALDASHVYWRGENGIFRVPLAGGDVLHWQHIACGFDITVVQGWAYFGCEGTLYRRRTSEADEVSSSDLVAFAPDSYHPQSTSYWTGYPFATSDHLYYLNGGTVESVSLVDDMQTSYELPHFVAVFDIWVDGERLFATVATDDQNRTSFLVEFPKLGQPKYEIVTDLASNFGRIDGFTPKWLYLHPYSEINRIPRP
jgi:hypothetical protein